MKWVIVGLFAFGALMTVTSIGKPRKPMTPEVAALVVFFDALLIAGTVVWL